MYQACLPECEHLPVSSSTGQHLVDPQDVERVDTYPHVELVLAHVLDHVFVGTDTGSLQRLPRQLLMLVRHQMDTQGKIVYRNLLRTKIIDSDLWI